MKSRRGLLFDFPKNHPTPASGSWPVDCPHMDDDDEHACTKNFGLLFSCVGEIMHQLKHDDPDTPLGMRVSLIHTTLRAQTRLLYLILSALLAGGVTIAFH